MAGGVSKGAVIMDANLLFGEALSETDFNPRNRRVLELLRQNKTSIVVACETEQQKAMVIKGTKHREVLKNNVIVLPVTDKPLSEDFVKTLRTLTKRQRRNTHMLTIHEERQEQFRQAGFEHAVVMSPVSYPKALVDKDMRGAYANDNRIALAMIVSYLRDNISGFDDRWNKARKPDSPDVG